MDENQKNSRIGPDSPNRQTQSITTEDYQTTPSEFPQKAQQPSAQLMDLPKHPKVSPSRKILIISFAFLLLSTLIIVSYYFYTLFVAD